VVLVRPLSQPHHFNVDVLPLRRKELRKLYHVFPRAPLSVTSTLLPPLYLYLVLLISSQIGKFTLVAYLENLSIVSSLN
jgi:hypothetical protein